MGITGRYASRHQFSLFVIKCVNQLWRPWQVPYTSPCIIMFIFIICKCCSGYLNCCKHHRHHHHCHHHQHHHHHHHRHHCHLLQLFIWIDNPIWGICVMITPIKGFFSVFFADSIWMGYNPVTFHVELPGKFFAPIWTLNHFDVYSLMTEHYLSLWYY